MHSDITWKVCAVCQRFLFQCHNISNHEIILSSRKRTGDLPEDWITEKCPWMRQNPSASTSEKPTLLPRYDPDPLYRAKLVSINLYFVFQKVCDRKPILTINASHLRSIACFAAQKKKASVHPWPTELHFLLLLMHCKGFFHINLKLYIWEIPVQRQSMLCFSVWPFAITRMCKYNLAQVKFNQSPQAQRNLHLPEKNPESVSLQMAQGSCKSF